MVAAARGCKPEPPKFPSPQIQPQVSELGRLHRQWLSDLDSFKSSLCEQGVEPKALEYVNEAFGRFAEHIRQIAG